MFCPNCGKQIRDNINFCEYCGTKLNNNTEENTRSYYKSSYKKNNQYKKGVEFGETLLKGMLIALVTIFTFFGIMIGKSHFSNNVFSLDKIKYQQYIDDPSMIPELTEPETLNGLINNLKEVQKFLLLYFNFSDDEVDTKMEVFDKYRTELLKLQKFSNSNLLQENVKYQIPRNKKEFKEIEKQYAKILSTVGLMIVADDGYSKYHLAEDPRFTYKKYGKYMTSDISAYLKLRAKHYENFYCKDSLTVKPYRLAERIGDYEQFMNENKDFKYENEIRDLLFTYTLIYSFTTDRADTIFVKKKLFPTSDRKFLNTYTNSNFKPIFERLLNSNDGISVEEFDKLYPYEYEKNLESIKPASLDLLDVFPLVRKNIMSLKSNDDFEYTYIASEDAWFVYDASKALKKGDVILAKTETGYDIYDYKYKKTNQTIRPNEEVKFIIKSGKLLAYLPNHLQLACLEGVMGSYSFKTLSVKSIKKYFPDVLLINISTFGDTSVQINKPAGEKTYMLISTSGLNYEGYKISGNVELGEIENIFTITTDESTQVNYTTDEDGESYHMYFITQIEQNKEQEKTE